MCSVVPWIYQQVKSIWKWLESSDMQNYFMVFFSKSELSKLSMDMDSSNIKIFNENKWETVRERQNIYLNRNQFSSVTHSCQTLCNLMDCSMPGFPVHHHLPKFAQTHVHQVGDDIQPSHSLLSTSPPASIFSSIRVFSFFFFFFLHQDLFQWVSSLHQVAKVMMLQLQHQSFQWIFRTDFLSDGLVGSPHSQRDSQESSPIPQFRSINSLVLGFP